MELIKESVAVKPWTEGYFQLLFDTSNLPKPEERKKKIRTS